MNPSHRWTLLGSLSLAAALGAAGCSRDTPPAPPADKPVEVSKPVVEAPKPAAEARDGDRKDGDRKDGERPGPGDLRLRTGGAVGSPEMLLATALRELTLTDEQKKAIEAAAESVHGDRGDDHDSDPAGRKALAAGVRAGKVDAKAAAAHASAEDPKVAERRARATAALKTLHSTLKAEQRKALVEAVTKRVDAIVAPNDSPEAGPNGGRGMGPLRGVRGSRVMRLTRDLELSDEQKKNVEKALEGLQPKEDHKAQAEASRTAMKARLAPFATDTFDAAAYVKAQAEDAAKNRPAPGVQLANELAVVVPILTEAQRTKLAAKLEK